jgi:hypothetical protein
MVAQL